MIDVSAHDDLFEVIARASSQRLAAQLRFVVEIDRLKSIFRQSPLTFDPARRENDAEHSWHLAMLVMVLSEFASPGVDVSRATRMLLIHDIVEIDAGDTFLYDGQAQSDQEEREQRAADRIFGLLPADQTAEFRALWDEFEAHETADARFARTMDRFQPFLHNVFTGGAMWRHHGVRAGQVRRRMSVIADGSPDLHALVENLIELAVERGYLAA